MNLIWVLNWIVMACSEDILSQILFQNARSKTKITVFNRDKKGCSLI